MSKPQRNSPTIVRRLALALPEAKEGAHFGQPDFRVNKKIFATLPVGGQAVSLKTTPANLEALVATDPAAFRDAWRGRWVTVRLDRVSRTMLRDLLTDAWRLVAPKRLAPPPT